METMGSRYVDPLFRAETEKNGANHKPQISCFHAECTEIQTTI